MPRSLLHLSVLCLAVFPGRSDEGQPSPLDSGDVLELWLKRPPISRTEYFVFCEAAEDASPATMAEIAEGALAPQPGEPESEPILGAIKIYSAVREGEACLESHYELFGVATRVVHVEQLDPDGPRLVWREMRSHSGRTVRAEWGQEGGELAMMEWSGVQQERRLEQPDSGAMLPLYLRERVREGAFLQGAFEVFDPLAGQVETRIAKTEFMDLAPLADRSIRSVRWIREDGSLAEESWFFGEELIAFRFAEGGPMAVRVDRKRFDTECKRSRARVAVKPAGETTNSSSN